MSEVQSTPVKLQRSYPRTLQLDNGQHVQLRLMGSGDVHRVLAFARSLPEEDLEFLRVDITRMLVVMLWVQNIKAGNTVTLLALDDQDVIGYASVHHDQVTWQRHLGDLRIQVSPPYRSQGLGGALGREIFALAPALGIRKIVAHITPNQKQAIALVGRSGFRHEALLHDYVIDRHGRTKDLVVMVHDVAAPSGGDA
jgi:L-amino acid N-acyltransferase YncA